MKIDLSAILEMVEQEDKKIKENKAPVESKQDEATLDIQGLFSLFEELEPTLKEESPAPSFLVSDEMALDFIIPKIIFRENDVPVGQDVVKEFVTKNLYGQTSLIKKMQSLNLVATMTSTNKVYKAGNKFENLVNRIALTEAIMSTFNQGFASTTAGNVNEMIVSLFYEGATLLPTIEANRDKDVTDFYIGKVSYTLKTTSPNSARTSSALNFLNTLSNYSKIISLDCEKIIEGKKVIGFNISEEEITAKNAPQKVFLGDKSKRSGYIGIESNGNIEPIKNYTQYVQAFEERGNPNTAFRFILNLSNGKTEPTQDPKKILKCFQGYFVSYKHGQKAQSVIFNTKQMREQLQTLIKDVVKNIVTLKISLELLGKSMSKYFVSGAEDKKALRQQMLDAAQKTIPKQTEEIVTKAEE